MVVCCDSLLRLAISRVSFHALYRLLSVQNVGCGREVM